jgi:alkyl sulfatase BDS1-like metallo-beta-lactamase superfamily hydrolase
MRLYALARTSVLLGLAVPLAAGAQQEGMPRGPGQLQRIGRDVAEAVQVRDSIWMVPGFGNTFLVVTPAGNVVVDTSLAVNAPRHRELLRKVSDAPVRYILLTHGHGDHNGGVEVWKEPGTEIVAQEQYVELLHYQHRLRGFFGRRNAAQFQGQVPLVGGRPGAQSTSSLGQEPEGPDRVTAVEANEARLHKNYGAALDATTLFDEEHSFELGGLRFELYHTPGETYEHLTVWLPQLRAAFVGDNYYGSFPNLYTLRGTKPRWALDYVESLDRVLALGPETVLPSHGDPIVGEEEVRKALTRYRDAILYVHDATVRGMNEGKDVFTLMREIRLPPELEVGEGYGTIAWSVRGIYDGYAGWFDGNPATMYATPPAAAYPELVRMAGGVPAVAARAGELVAAGSLLEGLHLADMALAAAPADRAALEARLRALEALEAKSQNSNERGWLRFGIGETRRRLETAAP